MGDRSEGVSVENFRDVLFLASCIVLAVGANETIGSTNGDVTWTLQNSTGGHPEKLAYNNDENVIAAPPPLSSSAEISPPLPIPFQSKWLLCSSA